MHLLIFTKQQVLFKQWLICFVFSFRRNYTAKLTELCGKN